MKKVVPPGVARSEGPQEASPETWTPQRRAKLARLLRDGMSFRKAAERLEVPRGSVCWATARFGIGRAPDENAQPEARRPDRAEYIGDRWDETKLTERWADRRKA